MTRSPKIRLEPGSFRDRDGRIFYHQGAVLRGLSRSALADWEALAATRFFRRSCEDGRVVRTRRADIDPAELAAISPNWVAALEHETIPFLSYPYEWSFSMLREAALLQLDLLLAALAEGMILKDATPYNIQFRGTSPQFIDIASFTRLRPGEPWVGYLQFCELFLYPLLLAAYKDLPFGPWLRGSIDGIEPKECAAVMSFRDLFRPGVFTHVVLQAKLQERAASVRSSVRRELVRSGFDKRLVVHNVQRLRRLIVGLSWKRARSTWSDYGDEHSYGDDDLERKRAFVARAASLRRWPVAWDLGANTGAFSRVVAEHADLVVAMDADELAIDRMYRQAETSGNILPLVVDLADPSPGLGWRSIERRPLEERARPQLVLALALLHHLSIGRNLPLAEIVDWLASLGGHLVVEFVSKQDPMTRRLLLNKDDVYFDYARETFERLLAERFTVLDHCALACGTRFLYFAEPR